MELSHSIQKDARVELWKFSFPFIVQFSRFSRPPPPLNSRAAIFRKFQARKLKWLVAMAAGTLIDFVLTIHVECVLM